MAMVGRNVMGLVFIHHLTPRAPDRATESMLSKCSIGHPSEGIGEATPSAGPVTLLVRWRHWIPMARVVP